MKRSAFLQAVAGAAIASLRGSSSSEWREDDARKEKTGGEETSETKCKADFVDGTHQQNPNCKPQTKTLDTRCTLNLYKIIYPGSQYDSKAGRDAADAELKRAVDYYAKYCIDINVVEIPITDKETTKKMRSIYESWMDGIVQRLGGKTKLGTSSLTKAERATFRDIATAIQNDAEKAKPAGRKLVVVFMDEYIGGSDGRDTLVSSCQESMMQIGINWVDSGSSHILAHELIHAMGKPGPGSTGAVTWPHSSNCGNALSKVDRIDSRVTTDLSGRLLDVAEYLEIGQNKCAGLLKCHKVQ